MTRRSEHHMVISKVEYFEEDGVEDRSEVVDVEFRLECGGVNESCQAWERCMPCYRRGEEALEDYYADDAVVHGQHHQQIDGFLMLPTGRCVTDVLDGDQDELAYDLAATHGPGRYRIDFDTEESNVYLSLLESIP